MRMNVSVPGQVGEILRARRKTRKLSQAELAAQLGISQSRLSIIEQSPESLTLDRLVALCHVLGLRLVLEDEQESSAPTKRAVKPAW